MHLELSQGLIKANDGVSGVGHYYTTLGIILVFTTCVYNNTFWFVVCNFPLLKLFDLYSSVLLVLIDMINKASLLSFHKME